MLEIKLRIWFEKSKIEVSGQILKESALRSLQSGLRITSIKDVTPIPHNDSDQEKEEFKKGAFKCTKNWSELIKPTKMKLM